MIQQKLCPRRGVQIAVQRTNSRFSFDYRLLKRSGRNTCKAAIVGDVPGRFGGCLNAQSRFCAFLRVHDQRLAHYAAIGPALCLRAMLSWDRTYRISTNWGVIIESRVRGLFRPCAFTRTFGRKVRETMYSARQSSWVPTRKSMDGDSAIWR